MVRILADSTCDLSPELVERYGIGIIPLYVHLGENEYRDGVDITPEELYRWSDEHKTTPKTAAPGIEDIQKFLEAGKDTEDEFVIFTISSSMSASFNNCRLAADSLDMTDRVFVIDSANLSTGIGLMVIRAAELAAQGRSGSQIAAQMDQIRGNVRASFVVDTLEYLHRGGRCSGLSAFMGSVLRLHPKIVVEHGAMRPDHKYRGHIDSVILKYVHDMEEALKKAQPERVFITHSSCERETVEAVRAYLEGLGHFDRVIETNAGGVISSHCGPGTLGVLYVDPKE